MSSRPQRGLHCLCWTAVSRYPWGLRCRDAGLRGSRLPLSPRCSPGSPLPPGPASSPDFFAFGCTSIAVSWGLFLAACYLPSWSHTSGPVEGESGMLWGQFRPCPLTGVLAPRASSFSCSILLRQSPPWWVSLTLSCGLAWALCLGPEPCWYWDQPAPWWEKLPMSAQLCCDLPAPRSCPLSPGSLRGAPAPVWRFQTGFCFPQILCLFLVRTLVCCKLFHHSWEGSLP